MNEAIKLAIEKGGYEIRKSDRTSILEYIAYLNLEPEAMLLDPLFWQALGKALNWNMTDSAKTKWHLLPAQFALAMTVYDNTPTCHWHRYIDWINDGKDVDEFFKQLIHAQ